MHCRLLPAFISKLTAFTALGGSGSYAGGHSPAGGYVGDGGLSPRWYY